MQTKQTTHGLHRTAATKRERYVCPWCWFESAIPQACACGAGTLKRERQRIVHAAAHLRT